MHQKGFSLLEIIIVLVLLGTIFGTIIVSYRSSILTNTLFINTKELLDTLRTANVYARDQKDNSSWGVRNADDFQYELVSSTGGNEVVVEKRQLDEGNKFQSGFVIWFEKGSGYTTDHEIVIMNRNSKSTKLKVLSTGIVEEVLE